MKKTLILLSVLTAFIGCAPSSSIQKPQELQTPSYSTAQGDHVVSRDALTEKINALSLFLEEDTIFSDNRMLIISLKRSYEVMRDSIDASATAQPPDYAIRDFISGLEKANDSLLSARGLSQEERKKGIEKLSKEIKDIMAIYRKGDTKAVIAGCDSLQAEYGPDAFTLELTAALVSSLAKEGRMQEAIALGDATAPAIKNLGEFCDFPERLSSWKADLQKKQELKGEPVEQRRLREILDRADSFAGKGEFDRAKELLIDARAEFKDDASLFQIDKALEKVEERREGFLEERIAIISKRGEIIAEARDFISREMPEEALARLKVLDFGDGQPDSEAGALKAEAVERIISKERNRAARIFLQAKDTKDPASKEKLLRSSYEALKSLVERYPDSPSVKKIMENMQAVEKELSAIKKPLTSGP